MTDLYEQPTVTGTGSFGGSSGGELPVLRSVLAPAYANLPKPALDRMISEVVAEGATADDVESIFSDIGQGFSNLARGLAPVVQRAAPVIGRALPGVVQGALSGAAFGPAGIIGGAALGGLNAAPVAAGQAGGRMPAPPTSAAPRPRPSGVAYAPPLGAGQQLVAALARPETLNALLAMLLGPAGQRVVAAGPEGAPVPVGSVASMLSGLAGHAAAEYAEAGDDDAEEAGIYDAAPWDEAHDAGWDGDAWDEWDEGEWDEGEWDEGEWDEGEWDEGEDVDDSWDEAEWSELIR